MANPAGSQQQAGAAPEAIWMPFIRDLYPNLFSQTHFLPPLHFNLTPQNVVTIAGQTVSVRDNPSSSGSHRQPLPPPPAQVAGMVFVENPPFLQRLRIQDSDKQDDSAQQHCLQALSNIPNQVMVVISSLQFQKYLNNYTNPLHAAAIAQLPVIGHRSIPPHIADGECDIVIIHRRYGLLIGEIKSLGGSSYFGQQPPSQQIQILTRKLEGPKEALEQIRNQETALRHLVSDLPPVRITKTLFLPNILARQLRTALHTSPSLIQTLCQTLSLPADVSLAVSRCLCEEDLQQSVSWWQMLHTGGSDQAMTDGLYERLVARFCGPATTVDIPTAGPPRKVLRSWGEAVAETGLRFSSLTLTPAQVALLDRNPEPQFLYLEGPPGTGKTVVLLLKALQWVRQGRQVIIVCGDGHNQAVTMLLEAQLHSIVGPAAGTRVQRHYYNFFDPGFDARAVVSSLQRQIGPGPVLFLFEEISSMGLRVKYIQWLVEVRAQLPAVSVWAAGVYRMDKEMMIPPPSWLEVQTLLEALRCPPTVTRELQQMRIIQEDAIRQYVDPQWPVATQGPPVQKRQHTGQPGHVGHFPWQCVACIDYVADVIRQLRVGQPGQPLQYRDVWILYGVRIPQASDLLVQRFQQYYGFPVHVVTSGLPTEADARELAVAVVNQIMVTEVQAVQGLERRVVVALEAQKFSTDLHSQSRCCSSLYVID